MSRPEHIKALLADEALQAAFAAVEKTGLEMAVYAETEIARAAACAEVRAIRSVIGKLERMARANPDGDTGA